MIVLVTPNGIFTFRGIHSADQMADDLLDLDVAAFWFFTLCYHLTADEL